MNNFKIALLGTVAAIALSIAPASAKDTTSASAGSASSGTQVTIGGSLATGGASNSLAVGGSYVNNTSEGTGTVDKHGNSDAWTTSTTTEVGASYSKTKGQALGGSGGMTAGNGHASAHAKHK